MESGKRLKAETAEARRIFLFGGEDGKRKFSIKTLSEITGVHENTLRLHWEEWEQEREQILRNGVSLGFSRALSENAWQDFNSDERWMREQLDTLKKQIEVCEDVHEHLLELIENFDGEFTFEHSEFSQLMQLMTRFTSNVGSKDKLLARFQSLFALWKEASGLDANFKATLSAMNETARGQAKLKLAAQNPKEGDEPETRDVTPSNGASVFKKRKKRGKS